MGRARPARSRPGADFNDGTVRHLSFQPAAGGGEAAAVVGRRLEGHGQPASAAAGTAETAGQVGDRKRPAARGDEGRQVEAHPPAAVAPCFRLS